jgi:hypothetical protein
MNKYCPECGCAGAFSVKLGSCDVCACESEPVEESALPAGVTPKPATFPPVDTIFAATIKDRASFNGSTITVPARLSRAGDYPDKGISLTVADFDAAAAQVSADKPVAMNMAHVSRGTILDGLLGRIERVYRQGEELWGDVAVPSWLASVAREAGITRLPLSAEWDRSTKRLTGCAWEKHPRIPDAALQAAFNATTAGKPASTAGAIFALLTLNQQADRRHEGKTPMLKKLLALLPFLNLEKPEAIAAFADLTGEAEKPTEPAKKPVEGETAEFAAIRERAEKAEKSLVEASAKAWAASVVSAKKALPSEEASLIALFTQAALDDAKSPATVTFSAGKDAKTGTRVDALKATYEARTAHSLTEELIDDAQASALFNREGEGKKPGKIDNASVYDRVRKSQGIG